MLFSLEYPCRVLGRPRGRDGRESSQAPTLRCPAWGHGPLSSTCALPHTLHPPYRRAPPLHAPRRHLPATSPPRPAPPYRPGPADEEQHASYGRV